jgi:xanthine/uracil permease
VGAPSAPARPPELRRPASSQGAISTTLTGRTYGDPPPNPFGGLPVSELAIFFGAIAVLVGWRASSGPPLVVGVIVCVLGVAEVTAREHFSGYRSHTTLLAALPAVGIGVALIALVGGSLQRGTLLLVVIPVFGILFWLLRKRHIRARQARLIRPPAP